MKWMTRDTSRNREGSLYGDSGNMDTTTEIERIVVRQ